MISSLKQRVMEKIACMDQGELMILLEVLKSRDRFTEKRNHHRMAYSASAEYVSRTVKGRGKLKDIGVGGLFMTLDPRPGILCFWGRISPLGSRIQTKEKM